MSERDILQCIPEPLIPYIGFGMNVLSTCAFACTAAVVYKRMHTLKGAILGLIAGVLTMTLAMLLWNYIITPIYMGYPREAVSAMLVPVFLPFNLIKGILNMAFTMLLYKPVSSALRKAELIERSREKRETKTGLYVAALLLLATGILAILAMRGVI